MKSKVYTILRLTFTVPLIFFTVFSEHFLFSAEMNETSEIYFQSHRGGLKEVPENTLAALRYTWKFKGGIPEVDVRTTADGILVCIHDDTLDRTTNTSSMQVKVSEKTFHELRQYDAGGFFHSRYSGEKIPSLKEVFFIMRGKAQNQIYLDIKDADLKDVASLVVNYNLQNQVIFVHSDPKVCAEMQSLYENVRTMTWLNGSSEEIKKGFQEIVKSDFKGLSQIQFHLNPIQGNEYISYELESNFLKYAFEETKKRGIDFQVRPKKFDKNSIYDLKKLGIRWFVTDSPQEFINAVNIVSPDEENEDFAG
ncbi:MAG: glycerophosphoryl diester phosphodiesterase [Halioglobus sp.]|jgi:glycerophosphoryl diester phosphodiesterase